MVDFVKFFLYKIDIHKTLQSFAVIEALGRTQRC